MRRKSNTPEQNGDKVKEAIRGLVSALPEEALVGNLKQLKDHPDIINRSEWAAVLSSFDQKEVFSALNGVSGDVIQTLQDAVHEELEGDTTNNREKLLYLLERFEDAATAPAEEA